jgi:DNA polymerase III subunit delta
MPWTPAQLDRHLTAGDLKPTYLLAGEEHLLLLEAADAIRARARELAYDEREVLEADASFDWNDLARAGASLSLFGSRRVIDLRLPTGKPGKEGAATITAFIADPPPDTVLMITSTQWSKAHEAAWVTAVEKAGAFVPFWPLKPPDLPGWIAARAGKAGLKLTRDAIALLIERIEGNLLAAAQEIGKLTLLSEGRMLDAAALEELVADSARFDVFALADAALSGDTRRALHMIAALQAEGEQVPGLLSWIVNQVQLMVRLSVAVESGQPVEQAMRNERVWQSRTGLYRAALSRGRASFWEAILAIAARVERVGKGRAAGDPWREFERLIGAITEPKFARAVLAS